MIIYAPKRRTKPYVPNEQIKQIYEKYKYYIENIGGYCRVPTKGRRGAWHLPVGVNLQSNLTVGEKPLNNAKMLPPCLNKGVIMAKVAYKKFNTLKILGLKLFEFKSEYVEYSTEEDTEEIQDEIRLHELKGKNNGKR